MQRWRDRRGLRDPARGGQARPGAVGAGSRGGHHPHRAAPAGRPRARAGGPGPRSPGGGGSGHRPRRAAASSGRRSTAVTEALARLDPESSSCRATPTRPLAGALAAASLDLPLVHVEAGLRSLRPRDARGAQPGRRRPSRRPPLRTDRDRATHLLAEGHRRPIASPSPGTRWSTPPAASCPDPTSVAPSSRSTGLDPAAFVLATFHRPENVDDHGRLATILAELATSPFPVLLPVHPRTADRAHAAGIALDRRIP